MRKLLLICLLAVFFVCGCSNESDTWDTIVNKEWSNLEVWAGSGFYFHEDDNVKYCTFMIYGSGVNVAGYHTSEVRIDENRIVVIQLPSDYASSYLGDEVLDVDSMSTVELIYSAGMILVNDNEFEVHEGISNYEYIIEIEDEKSE